jgi:hypothetical protein
MVWLLLPPFPGAHRREIRTAGAGLVWFYFDDTNRLDASAE